MKKSKLLILTAASLLLAPASLSPVQAADEPVKLTEQTELTTDQFIEKYCGSWLETVHPDQTRTREFKWFTLVDEKSAPIVTKGRLLFDTYPKEKQEIILKAAQAAKVDYLKYSDACKKLVEEKKLPLPEDEPEKKENPQPNVPAATPIIPAPIVDVLQNVPSTPANTQTPLQTPQSSDTPANDPGTQPLPSNQTPADPALPDADQTGQPADLALIEQVEEETADEQIKAISQKVAEAKGLENANLEAVRFSLTVDGQTLSTGRIWKLTAADKSVYFEVLSIEGQKAHIRFCSPSGCSWDLTAQTLSLKPEEEMDIELPAPAQEENKPSADPVPEDKPDGADQEQTTDPDQNNQTNKEETPAANDALKPEATPKDPVQQQTPDIMQPASNVAQAPAKPATLITNTAQAKTDPQSDAFINSYCVFNGSLIARANRSNYQQILSGIRVWNTLSSTQKGWINTYLLNHAGIDFQTLYRQASQIRLGLPVTGTSLRPVYAPSVPTAATDDLSFWIASFGFSAIALGKLLKFKREQSE